MEKPPLKPRTFEWKIENRPTYFPASQNTDFLNGKMTKNWQKRYQKEHPAFQKTEVLHDKLITVLPLGILKKKSGPPTSPIF